MGKEKRLLEDTFLREKPARILLGLKTRKTNVYATMLSKEADCTYSHTIKILELFRKMGIVKFDKKGRVKYVALTDDGWDIAQNMDAIQKKFKQLEDGVAKKAKEERKPKEKKKPARK